MNAATVALTDTTGTIAFNGAVTATTLSTANQGYNLQFNAGGTITGAMTFANTGTVRLGNDAADNLAFTGGVVATAPSSKSIAGTISAAGTGVINLGTTGVTVTADATVGGTSTGQITLGNATVNDGATLIVGTGVAAAISLGSVSGVTGLAGFQPDAQHDGSGDRGRRGGHGHRHGDGDRQWRDDVQQHGERGDGGADRHDGHDCLQRGRDGHHVEHGEPGLQRAVQRGRDDHRRGDVREHGDGDVGE